MGDRALSITKMAPLDAFTSACSTVTPSTFTEPDEPSRRTDLPVATVGTLIAECPTRSEDLMGVFTACSSTNC